MENLFYKFIDDKRIEKAPIPLSISGKNIFTNDEKTYNENGYYKLVREDYPQDTNSYTVVYELKDNAIYMTWRIAEISTENKIYQLKESLANTDYQAIKYAEGWLTTEEYEPLRLQRQEWRDEINRLEQEVDVHIEEV